MQCHASEQSARTNETATDNVSYEFLLTHVRPASSCMPTARPTAKAGERRPTTTTGDCTDCTSLQPMPTGCCASPQLRQATGARQPCQARQPWTPSKPWQTTPESACPPPPPKKSQTSLRSIVEACLARHAARELGDFVAPQGMGGFHKAAVACQPTDPLRGSLTQVRLGHAGPEHTRRT